MEGRRIGRSTARFLVAGAALSLGAFLALAVMAASEHYFGVDLLARSLVHLTRHPLLDPAMRGVSLLGDQAGLVPLVALGCGLLWRARRRWAYMLPVQMAGTGALQLVAKWAVDRPRPDLAAWGFPSGHVLSLVVFFGLMAYVLCTSSTGLNWRWAGSLGCGSTVGCVAFSRLYLERHWLSDVAGGFVLGLAFLLLTIWLVETVGGKPRTLRAAAGPAGASMTPAG
jgi:membrane-associated phospholipid phosphatase